MRPGAPPATLNELFALLKLPEQAEGAQHVVRIAEPAKAIVPGASAAGRFGNGRSHGGDDGAGIFEAMKLEGKGGADDFLLEERRNIALFHPLLPVAGGFIPESLTQGRQGLFDGRAPGEREVVTPGEGERLAAQVRQRDVGGEAQLAGEALVDDVVRALHEGGFGFGPSLPGIAGDDDARGAFEQLDDPHELRGAEGAAELEEPGSEVDDAEGTGRGSKCGLENIGAGEVALRAGFTVGGADAKAASILFVEKGREHGFGIETWKTAPNYCAAGVNQRRKLEVSDHTEVLELHISHGSTNVGMF